MATRRLYFVRAKDKEEPLTLLFLVASNDRSNARSAAIEFCKANKWAIEWPSAEVVRGASWLLRDAEPGERSIVYHLGTAEE